MATRPLAGRAAIPPHTPGAGVGGWEGGQEGQSSGSPPGYHETQLGTITEQEALNQFVEEGGT